MLKSAKFKSNAMNGHNSEFSRKAGTFFMMLVLPDLKWIGMAVNAERGLGIW